MQTVRMLVIGAASLAMSAASVSGQETGFLNRTISVDSTEYRYQVYVPRGFQESASFPIILALHGGAGAVNDIETPRV